MTNNQNKTVKLIALITSLAGLGIQLYRWNRTKQLEQQLKQVGTRVDTLSYFEEREVSWTPVPTVA